MLGPDARDLGRVRCDEPRATRACRHARKAGPGDAGPPERRGPSVQYHRRSVAGAVEIDRLEILVLLQSEAIEDIARQDRKTGALCAERDRLVDEIANGLVGTVGAHHEHPGAGKYRGQDFQRCPRPADACERFVARLSGDQRNIELVSFQQRNILVAALGVARLDEQRQVGLVDDLGKPIAVNRKAAARRCRSQTDRGLLNSLASLSILRHRAARQQQHGRAGDTGDVHGVPFWIGAPPRARKDPCQDIRRGNVGKFRLI